MKPARIAAAVAVILAIVALGHLVVYEAIVHFYAVQDPATLHGLGIAFGILTVSFIAMTLATSRFYSKITSWLYALSAVWLGTLYWLFAAAVLGVVMLALGDAFGFDATFANQAVLVVALVVSACGVINSNATRVTRYTVAIRTLPEQWIGKKVAVVSDTHLGGIRGFGFAKKIVRMVNEQQPEIVLLAGDFFDGPKAPFVKFASPLKNITAPKGVYFAEGNHEEFSPSGKYDEALRASGVHVLVNEKAVVDGLEIIGINYDISNGNEQTAAILAKIGVDQAMPSILIKHAPTGIDAVAAAGVDLQVSGHTHQGQIWPGPLLTRKIFGEFEYGMHPKGDRLTVVTSSGAGTWGPPQRVGTHSEIVIITLTRK